MKSSLLVAVVGSGLIGYLASPTHAAQKMTPDEMKTTVGQAKIAGQVCQTHAANACIENRGGVGPAAQCQSTHPVEYGDVCITDPTQPDTTQPTHYCNTPVTVTTCVVVYWIPTNAAGAAVTPNGTTCGNDGYIQTGSTSHNDTKTTGCS